MSVRKKEERGETCWNGGATTYRAHFIGELDRAADVDRAGGAQTQAFVFEEVIDEGKRLLVADSVPVIDAKASTGQLRYARRMLGTTLP